MTNKDYLGLAGLNACKLTTRSSSEAIPDGPASLTFAEARASPLIEFRISTYKA